MAAANFYALSNLHPGGFDHPDAATLYRAYEKELYRFDQLYRHFCESADTAEEQGWNILKPLRTDIEAHYVNGYLTHLALAWGQFIEPPGGLLTQWRIKQVLNQYRFFDHTVKPWLEEGEQRQRNSILHAIGGLACKYDDLIAKKKEEGREFVKNKRVVYIYHDTVDAIGDDSKTEGKTSAAVRIGDQRTGSAGQLHHQQLERSLCHRHGGSRVPLHRNRPRRERIKPAQGQARRHGVSEETLSDRPAASTITIRSGAAS